MKFVPKGAIDNNPGMVKVMAEPMLARITDAYMWH